MSNRRRRLLDYLDGLGELRVRFGKDDARSFPGGFWMSTPKPCAAGWEHVVTLAWGYPPAPEVRGLPYWLTMTEEAGSGHHYGLTDERGQFQVHSNVPGGCVVEYLLAARTTDDLRRLRVLCDESLVSPDSALRLVEEGRRLGSPDPNFDLEVSRTVTAINRKLRAASAPRE